MKQTGKVILMFLVGLLVACENEKYENVFDKAPEQRRKEYFEQLRTTLTQAGNGWIMQYFPYEGGPGYNLYAAFNNSGDVTLGAKNAYTSNVYKEYTSSYDLTVENGPSLVFTTYNTALHPFIDPDINQTGIADFEFLVYDLTDDIVRLKGKWTNLEACLNRLPGGITGEEYTRRAEETKQFLCPNGAPELILEAENKTYRFTNGHTSIFNIRESGSDTTITMPYIATTDGFRLYKELEIEGKKLLNFQLTNNRNDLICSDPGVNAKFHLATSGADFFINSLKTATNVWNIDKNSLGGVFAEAYTQIVNNCKTVYKEDFESLFLVYKSTRRSATLSFKSGGKYEGAFNFGVTLKEGTTNQIVFTNSNSADTNGNAYLKNIPGFDAFVNELGKDNYIVSTESSISVSSFKFTQVSNPNNWFRVMLNY